MRWQIDNKVMESVGTDGFKIFRGQEEMSLI